MYLLFQPIAGWKSPHREPRLLHEFFEASAAKYPDHCAIEWYAKEKSEDNNNDNNDNNNNKTTTTTTNNNNNTKRQLTYQEVNEISEGLSQTLSHYVEGECVVAIFLPRVDERVYVAQLATMKAGAAYLCIDHSFPDERIAFTVSDSAAKAVVTDKGRGLILCCFFMKKNRIQTVIKLCPHFEKDDDKCLSKGLGLGLSR